MSLIPVTLHKEMINSYVQLIFSNSPDNTFRVSDISDDILLLKQEYLNFFIIVNISDVVCITKEENKIMKSQFENDYEILSNEQDEIYEKYREKTDRLDTKIEQANNNFKNILSKSDEYENKNKKLNTMVSEYEQLRKKSYSQMSHTERDLHQSLGDIIYDLKQEIKEMEKSNKGHDLINYEKEYNILTQLCSYELKNFDKKCDNFLLNRKNNICIKCNSLDQFKEYIDENIPIYFKYNYDMGYHIIVMFIKHEDKVYSIEMNRSFKLLKGENNIELKISSYNSYDYIEIINLSNNNVIKSFVGKEGIVLMFKYICL